MSQALRIATDARPATIPLAAWHPVYAGTNPNLPCSSEFKALMTCLTRDMDVAECMIKYVALKACIRSHGLPVE